MILVMSRATLRILLEEGKASARLGVADVFVLEEKFVRVFLRFLNNCCGREQYNFGRLLGRGGSQSSSTSSSSLASTVIRTMPRFSLVIA